MNKPPSMHSNFFSSLKQVEKRLKLDSPSSSGNHSSPTSEPRLPVQLSSSLSAGKDNTESLISSAWFIHTNDQTGTCTVGGSEPPSEFLSISSEFPSAQKESPVGQSLIKRSEELNAFDGRTQNVVDDIQSLLNMLHLPEFGEEKKGQDKGPPKDGGEEGCCPSESEKQNEDRLDLEDVASDGEDYYCCGTDLSGKFVRMKAPMCQEEIQRLDGWIKHFLNDRKEVLEPFRLAHLLLGKAALAAAGDEDGFEVQVFPSTIDEYLHNYPPTNRKRA